MSVYLTPNRRLMNKARRTAREIVDDLGEGDKCVSCGYRGYIEVHHIDGDPLNNHPMNLAPLCRQCHRSVHGMEAATERMRQMKEDFDSLTAD